MGVESTGNKRTRAWVLVKAEVGQVREAAQAISELEIPGSSIVVRADVVIGPYDIVVPVDAESQEALTEVVLDAIHTVQGVEETLTVVVAVHNPWPPHLANGYVTEEEAAATNPVEPGPQGNNPFG